MKRALITAAALTLTAGAAFANTFSTPLATYDADALTATQKAQIFAVINSDEATSVQQRQIEAILSVDTNAGTETSRAAQAFFEANED
ncbi:hypothetical protein HMH01_02570 [Halovulum dunhuangense]|uniref:Uncharacterized protein n=1 Tax=Halovulum dunhuangense TaxID=1505036 RepID=A0A849KZ71_9RHOB|nr:hypothetical protein [Halovulum dunhuangense]NNU79312.1 hypothetical protein [Halovulum dunhuangense]